MTLLILGKLCEDSSSTARLVHTSHVSDNHKAYRGTAVNVSDCADHCNATSFSTCPVGFPINILSYYWEKRTCIRLVIWEENKRSCFDRLPNRCTFADSGIF